jgi:hypothetical protein
LAHIIDFQQLAKFICILGVAAHDTANMEKVSNSTRQTKVEAKEQTGVLVPLDSAGKSAAVQIATPLTAEEKQRLARLEKVIDAKLGDFFEVGSALMEIKGKELFRETHRNFNLYCLDRWGFGRSYANKLIGSAERIQLLPQDQTRPANEFQIRPFLKLEPEEFPKKWQTILDAAGTGKVTSRIVEETLQLPKRKRKRRKVKTTDRKEKVNELLDSLRAALKEKNVEDAMQELAKLEKLLRA